MLFSLSNTSPLRLRSNTTLRNPPAQHAKPKTKKQTENKTRTKRKQNERDANENETCAPVHGAQRVPVGGREGVVGNVERLRPHVSLIIITIISVYRSITLRVSIVDVICAISLADALRGIGCARIQTQSAVMRARAQNRTASPWRPPRRPCRASRAVCLGGTARSRRSRPDCATAARLET